MITVSVTLNGQPRQFAISPGDVLADVLREACGLTGCKVGCDQGVCGACTVLANGKPIAACATFMFAIDGQAITTIEGLASDDGPHPVQQAFLACGAFQCGFCTPGMILSAVALLAEHPDPDDSTIRAWLGGNLCRCTGYNPIVAAVRAAARRLPLPTLPRKRGRGGRGR
jgi:aerobic-type carbon monoxide dehydrogenase small subunit (CoxS/CutS family)